MKLGAEICARAVVLFADLRGYSRIAERFSPQTLVPLLNQYFQLLADVTYQHRGTIFHMAGDGLLVGFGVPHEQPDRAQRAICTAQEMLVRFAALAKLWRERSNIVAGLGIGLHEGDVAVASVGSRLFNSQTLVGDAVNIASRLCQRARAGEIVFSGTFRRTFNARSIVLPALQLPPITFRGRSEPIDLFCVPLVKHLDQPASVSAPPAVAREVVRHEELVARLAVPAHRPIRTAW